MKLVPVKEKCTCIYIVHIKFSSSIILFENLIFVSIKEANGLTSLTFRNGRRWSQSCLPYVVRNVVSR